MSKPFILYGWHLSYFSGKARCYLKYKGIPFVEGPLNLYTLMVQQAQDRRGGDAGATHTGR